MKRSIRLFFGLFLIFFVAMGTSVRADEFILNPEIKDEVILKLNRADLERPILFLDKTIHHTPNIVFIPLLAESTGDTYKQKKIEGFAVVYHARIKGKSREKQELKGCYSYKKLLKIFPGEKTRDQLLASGYF